MKTLDLPMVAPASPAVEPEAEPVSRQHDGRRVYVETYGCQMNVADTELMEGILRGAGYRSVTEPSRADVILVNTCAIRENAEERVFGRLGELTRYKKRKPWLVLGVTGCMAEHLKERIPRRAKAVDLIVGPDGYRRLPELIADHAADPLLEVRLDRRENYVGVDPVRREGVTAWVTIMRGCDRFCTFCVVPYTRGREKSVDPREIVRQVTSLAESGWREVCLLGQTVNSYRSGDTDFADLLRTVSAVEGIERVRFTSPHPADFTPKLIETFGEVREICPYVHLPLQSGSNEVLARMRRDYTVERYLEIVEAIRAARPGCALSTDVIAGFSGETDEDFAATLDVLREVRFDFAYMFRYSERGGTSAHRALPDDVPDEMKGERLARVIEMQESISAERYAERVGTTDEILVEGPAKKTAGSVFGRTLDFKGVVVPGEHPANGVLAVRITGSSPHTLFGEAIAS